MLYACLCRERYGITPHPSSQPMAVCVGGGQTFTQGVVCMCCYIIIVLCKHMPSKHMMSLFIRLNLETKIFFGALILGERDKSRLILELETKQVRTNDKSRLILDLSLK